MRFVGSREIYQAQLNAAILSALKGDYESALDTLEDAAKRVPRSLIFDQVKISMNQVVIERVAGVVDDDTCAQRLSSSINRIRGLQMPYLFKVLAANIAAANGEPQANTWDKTDQVNLAVGLPAGDTVWGLLMSVHWRY